MFRIAIFNINDIFRMGCVMGCFLSKSVENGIQIMPVYITVNVYIVTKRGGIVPVKKKFFLLIMVMGMALFMAACGSSNNNADNNDGGNSGGSDGNGDTDYKVGLVTDVGGVDD